MEETNTLTTFDAMTQSRQIQMMKTVVPYLKHTEKAVCRDDPVYGTLQYDVRLFKGGTGLIHVLHSRGRKYAALTIK